MRCEANVELNGGQCRFPAQEGSRYCATHRAAQETREDLTLANELALARVEVRSLLRAGASTEMILDALRLVAMLGRLEHRLRASHRRARSALA